MILLFISSCGTQASFQNSAIVPGAQGSVKVKKDRNHNYAIKVNLLNLAAPDRLTPPRGVYVVWMVTDNNATQNIGQIKSSSSLFSKALKGSFEAISSTKPVKIFITAEDDPSIQTPGMLVVLSTNNFE